MNSLCRILEDAELIVGYNLCGFDWTVLKKYFKDKSAYFMCREKTHDIFSKLRDATGIWFKLDRLLDANNMSLKSGDGLKAIEYWNEGKRDELQEYCEQDVIACARLSLKHRIQTGNGNALPNHTFGTATALSALRFSKQIS